MSKPTEATIRHDYSTIAAILCDRRLAQPDIVSIIGSFLIGLPVKWTLEKASLCGCAHLLDQLGKIAWVGVNEQFRQQRPDHAIKEYFASCSGDSKSTFLTTLTTAQLRSSSLQSKMAIWM